MYNVLLKAVIMLSRVDTKLSSSLTRLKNLKIEFDLNSIELFLKCLKLDSENSRTTRTRLEIDSINKIVKFD